MTFHFITSASNKKDYYEFIPIFAKQQRTIYPDCKITILYIQVKGETLPREVTESNDIVILGVPDGMNPSYVAQIMRLLYISKLETNDICVLCDIDLVLFKRFPFDVDTTNDQITNYGKLNKQDRQNSGQMAFCWTFMRPASCRRWLIEHDEGGSPALGVNVSKFLKDNYKPNNSGWGYNWTADQELLYSAFDKHTKYIERNTCDRIDRETPYMVHLKDRLYYYVDYHMPRPYSQYANLIYDWLERKNRLNEDSLTY